jgi:hypothetical protein
MKSKSLLIFLLGCSKMLVGQDSLTVETVQDSAFVAPQYSSVYDDVFMNKKEAKWLFKVDWMGIFSSPQVLNFEHKLNKNLSMNYSLGTVNNNSTYSFVSVKRKYVLGVQPRWYFKSKTSNSVSNLNGNYIGLNAMYSLDNAAESRINWGLAATYGIQRRVFNNWYIDWQFGLGIDKFQFANYEGKGSDDTHFTLYNKFTFGLAFGGGKKSPTNKCDLFNCFEEEKSLWKLDIRDIFEGRSDAFTISVNPEYERKIGKSSFSLNTTLGVSYTNWVAGYGLKAGLEPRYYYNMKKRIAKGKSANNLSGNYLSINVNWSYANYTYNYLNSAASKTSFSGSTYRIEPRWGIQRRLFKNGFLDLSLSPFFIQQTYGKQDEKRSDGTVLNSTPLKGLNDGFSYDYIEMVPLPRVYFKIGFAF